MNVTIVSHHAFPHIGGVETLVDMEIRALTEAGHKVVLITSDGNGSGHSPNYPASVRVIRVPAWHVLERRFRLPYPLFGPGLLRHLWREVGWCDCVHVHGFVFMSSVLALVIAWLRGRPRLLTDHGGEQHFESRLLVILAFISAHTLGRLSARLASRLMTYNTRIMQFLDRLVGKEGVTRFVPNPINKRLFRPRTVDDRLASRKGLGWSEERPKVLYVGRLLPEKGIDLLLAARSTEFDLVFCGPGDVSLLGVPLPPGVQHLPARPTDELLTVYHAADLVVVPSALREGFPLVIQEALACGVPVVTCHDPGYEPYQELTSFSMCQRDPVALNRSILHALESDQERRPGGTDPGLDGLFPSPGLWLEHLYGGLVEQGKGVEPALHPGVPREPTMGGA